MDGLHLLQTTDADRAFLKAEWEGLTARYAPGAETGAGLYNLISGHYSRDGRFYHNLRHVAELLRLLGRFSPAAENYDAVRFAAWFHDAVYDPRREDNEERSAELAVGSLVKLGVPASTVALVRETILATKGHSARGLPPDALLFLDADLAILGAPPETYAQYVEAIRREYAWVPELRYRRGRGRVLQSFLERSRIYQTPAMFARFETPARLNISLEIKALSRDD